MTQRREVWITGVGLLTCLGEGLDATWHGAMLSVDAVLKSEFPLRTNAVPATPLCGGLCALRPCLTICGGKSAGRGT